MKLPAILMRESIFTNVCYILVAIYGLKKVRSLLDSSLYWKHTLARHCAEFALPMLVSLC